jgi:hypothetical protein
MPHPPGATRRPRALAIFLALCVIGILAIALALRDEPSGTDLVSATDTSAVSSAADIALTAPVTTLAPDTTAAAVAPTTAPTTVAPTAPPTATPADELIPGFPVPADVETFLAQLEDDPSVIGPRGVDVEHELERLLGERSDRKRGERARELAAHADEWADEGTLDATVADHLIGLLEPIADEGSGGDDGDDD